MTTVLDPTGERQPLGVAAAPRPGDLEGVTVGLLDISKARGDVFLDRIEHHLTERGATPLRFTKPTFTKPAPTDLRQEISERCQVVIEALAD